MDEVERSWLLRTLGHPVLAGADGRRVEGLRRKDLALLAWLYVEAPRVHSRCRLAALLWAESDEARARHSLTQAIGRIQRATERSALAVERDTVGSTGAVRCDADLLLGRAGEPDELVTAYEGPFLEGFEAGFGSREFEEWAERRRAELRKLALRWLDRRSEEAEGAADWTRALHLGERAVQIDPVNERGHRRVMRALLELGDRNQALRHFVELERWLAAEVGAHPDPETLALAACIRATAPAGAPRSSPAPPPPPPFVAPPRAVDVEPQPSPAASSDISPPPTEPGEGDRTPAGNAPGPGARDPRVSPRLTAEQHASLRGSVHAAEHSAHPIAANDGGNGATEPRPSTVDPESVTVNDGEGMIHAQSTRRLGRAAWIAIAAAVLLVAALIAMGVTQRRKDAAAAPVVVANGEMVRVGHGPAYLVHGGALWRMPDEDTHRRCAGGWTRSTRRVRRLPAMPVRVLPSVHANPWLGGSVPVADQRTDARYVVAGCVLAAVPDSLTLRAIFGRRAERVVHVPAAVVDSLPRAQSADPYPVRPPGTLILGAGTALKWVVYHGGALNVTAERLATYCRAPTEAVRVTDAEFRYYRASATLPPPHPRSACGDAVLDARDTALAPRTVRT